MKIKQLAAAVLPLLAAVATASEPITFAIASDFHAPDVPGGLERVQAFIDNAETRNVDFIIELGDFARLDSASAPYRDAWNSFSGNRYHVIGNHDCDSYEKDTYVKGMNLPSRYYSFDCGNYHFVVLDSNNWADNDGNLIPYGMANYYGRSTDWADPQQLEWLKRDIASTNKRCFLFSHASIDHCIKNGDSIRKILEAENERAGYKKIVMAFSGHDHSNYYREVNGINYAQINSASYVWIGKDTRTELRFPKEVNERYSLMKKSITYDRPLWAIVTLSDSGVSIEGVKGKFMPPTPEEIGLESLSDYLPLVPYIDDFRLEY